MEMITLEKYSIVNGRCKSQKEVRNQNGLLEVHGARAVREGQCAEEPQVLPAGRSRHRPERQHGILLLLQ